MKFIIIFAALFAAAVAAPRPQETVIVKSESVVEPEKYHYEFETSDGTQAKSTGEIKNLGAENEGIAVEGFYSYISDDGVTYKVTYIADENGYQPQGDHLPSSPKS